MTDFRKLPSYWGCSFCGLMPDQVEKIVIGPGGLSICNKCIDVCVEALRNGTAGEAPGADEGVDAAPI